MATLGTMRARIARELRVDATTYAVDIDAAIFSAIAFYNDADYWFLEATPSVIVLSLTSSYTLETLIPGRSQICNIELQYNQSREDMLYRTPDEFAGMQSTFTGDPLYYTVFADTLMIQPVPSRTFSAVAWYTLRRSISASASASGVWTTEAEEIIRLHAKVDLCVNRIKDYAEAAQLQGKLSSVLAVTDEKTVIRRGSRRLKPSF